MTPTNNPSRRRAPQRWRCCVRGLVMTAWLWCTGAWPALGQAPPAPAPSTEPGLLTAEQMQQKIKEVGESANLDEAGKRSALDSYTKALQQLSLAEEWSKKSAGYEEQRQSAAQRLEQARARLESPAAEALPDLPGPEAPVKDLEAGLAAAEAALAEAKKALVGLEDTLKSRAARRVEVPKLLAEARERLAEAKRQLAAKPIVEQPVEVAQAARVLQAARLRAVEREIEAYEKELPSYEATAEALVVERDLAAQNVSRLEKNAKRWRELVNERRQVEAEMAARAAQKDVRSAEQLPSALQLLAEENAKLAKERAELVERIRQVVIRAEEVEKQLSRLKERQTSVTEKVRANIATAVLGPLLRTERASLTDLGVLQRNLKRRGLEIQSAQFRSLECQESRSKLADLEARSAELMQGILSAIHPDDQPWLQSEVRRLLQEQRTHLDSLIGDYENIYLAQAVQLHVKEGELASVTREYGKFIDEHILWIPSTSWLPSRNLVGKTSSALAWLSDGRNWIDAVRSACDSGEDVYVLVIAGLVLFPWLVLQRRLRGEIRRLGEEVSKRYTDTVAASWYVLLLTVVAALLWPAVWLFVGWRLTSSEAPEFARAIGAGFELTALVHFMFEVFRQTCRPGGLAEVHFRWRAGTVRAIRAQLRWLMPLELPVLFLLATMQASGNTDRENSLGRLAFCAALTLFAVFTHRLLKPGSLIAQDICRSYPGSWLERGRYVWHLLAVGTPLALVGLAFGGYYYTAVELAWRLLLSIWLILGLLVVNAMLARWLIAARGKLARGQSRRAKEAGEEAAPSEADHMAPAEVTIDFSAINVQTRKLLRVFIGTALLIGLFFTWADVLPALGVLRKVTLWTSVREVVRETRLPDGGIQTQSNAIEVPTTLADLLLVVVIVILTFVAGRNLPGLLEITVLQRLPFDAGGRYAVTTLSRYAITVVGLVLASSRLGLSWSSVQWLAAAVTVGLGFGLQEIFANFVSGVILLFERPMRVGDIVTVGDVSGVVTRIEMRATTIRDWDMKELVVPNKEFITGRVLNWTLNDKMNRVVIEVGIAYGSDVEKARTILLEAARRHPSVLAEPAPTAVFDGFGDSALHFVLRCYLPNLDNRLNTIHELHTAIDDEFRKARIEIAFPQRDIHVRTISGPVGPRPLPSAEAATPEGNGNHAERSARAESSA